jgi:hypothetical protein
MRSSRLCQPHAYDILANMRRILITSILLSASVLLTAHCGLVTTSTTTIAAVEPTCDLSVTYSGPTEPATFGGLSEDATQCAATSWKAYYAEKSPPTGSLFVNTTCDAQSADGSVTHPYCNIASTQSVLAQRDFSADDTTVAIHIDAGTYALAAELTTQSIRAKLLGLCSTKTTLTPASTTDPLVTLSSSNGAIALEGVTIVGGTTTLLSVVQGALTLTNVDISINNDNECLSVSSSGSSVTGQYIAINGNDVSTITFTQPTSPATSDASTSMPAVPSSIERCVNVTDGGQLYMEHFFIHDFHGVGVVVDGAGSTATFKTGVIEDIFPISATGEYGYGIATQSGGKATIEGVTLKNTYGLGVLGHGKDTTVSMTTSHVSAVLGNIISSSGVGLIVQQGAIGTVTNSELEGNQAIGLYASSGATLTASGLNLFTNPLNVGLADATLTLSESTISEAGTHASFGGQVGILIESFTAASDVVATLTKNRIMTNPGAGLYLYEIADGGMTVTLSENDFINNGSNQSFQSTWNAAIQNLATGVSFSDNCFQSQGTAAILLDVSAATLSQNSYYGTYIAVGIQQQRCGTTLTAVDTSSEINPNGVPHCLCGVRTDTGNSCTPHPVSPHIIHDFGVGEVEAIQ